MDAGRVVAEGRPPDLIAAHVGAEVVEVYLDEAADDAVATRLAAGPWRTERVGRVLYLYLRPGQDGARSSGSTSTSTAPGDMALDTAGSGRGFSPRRASQSQ